MVRRPLVDAPAPHLLPDQVREQSATRNDEKASAPRQKRDALQERAQRGAAAETPPDLEQQIPAKRWRAPQTATLLAGSAQDGFADRPPTYDGAPSLSSKDREAVAGGLML